MKIKNHIISFIVAVVMLMSLFPTAIIAQSTTIIAVDKVTDVKGGEISVPIRISDNIGICGATVSVAYDNRLTLTKVQKGNALSTLTMTMPGDLSANPVNLVWDGMDADSLNGIIATLVFNVPDIKADYNIFVNYENGDIVDGNLNALNPTVVNGKITISSDSMEPATDTSITVGSVQDTVGAMVSVPINISGSPGICGATLSVSYDSALTLSSINKGTAWSTLTMTTPGDLSANPINLVWDGMDADNSNGTIATLNFSCPNITGTYNVNVSYVDGDIVDGDLKPVNPEITNGKIVITSEEERAITVNISDKTAILKTKDQANGIIWAAFYNTNKQLVSVKQYSSDTDTINFIADETANSVKIMWWDNMRPLCDTQEIIIKQ